MTRIDLSELDNPSLGSILEERAKKDPDETLVLFDDQNVTCAEFNDQANRAANGLLELGVRKGDKVCLYLPNCPEWLYLWLGMAKIGAVLVPVVPGLSGRYVAHLINNSDAETVVVHSGFLGMFNAVADQLENVKNVIVDSRGPSSCMAELPQGAILMERLFESPADPPLIDVRHPDVSHIVYTSGTTGFPKGLVVRHREPRRDVRTSVTTDFDLRPGEVVYTCYALPACFSDFVDCLTDGLRAAFSREKRFDTFWDDIRRYNAVAFNYFADLIPSLLSLPQRKDDADNPARFCTGIMAPRDPEVVAAFKKRFKVEVVETYGSVEGGNVAINEEGKAGSMGKPCADVEVKIVDGEGNEVGPNEVGEIVHRRRSGEPIIVEYYKMPEESAAKTHDGWYHSDDLAYRDEDGHLYFVDRKLDVIKKGGRHIFASTIEAVVSRHDSVAECAAVGIASGPDDDNIKLCVVCKEGKRMEPEALLAFCAEKLESQMLPRYIQFRDSFPKSSRGKVQKYKLQAEGITAETWDRCKGRPDG